MLLSIQGEALSKFLVQDLGQQGRGGPTPGVHGPRHRGGLDRGGERFALTHAATVHVLYVLDDLDLGGDDLQFAANLRTHDMERVVAHGTGLLCRGPCVHAPFYRQMRAWRVPLTWDFFLAFIGDRLGGGLERGSRFHLGLIKQLERLNIRPFLGCREAALGRQTPWAFEPLHFGLQYLHLLFSWGPRGGPLTRCACRYRCHQEFCAIDHQKSWFATKVLVFRQFDEGPRAEALAADPARGHPATTGVGAA